eukprot:m.200053 g.200053  ORF g.200053 m.200053 type:complete len:1434 (+) comp18399_c0_seq5:698-4999(+)
MPRRKGSIEPLLPDERSNGSEGTNEGHKPQDDASPERQNMAWWHRRRIRLPGTPDSAARAKVQPIAETNADAHYDAPSPVGSRPVNAPPSRALPEFLKPRPKTTSSVDAALISAIADAGDTVNIWVERHIRVYNATSDLSHQETGMSACTTYGTAVFSRDDHTSAAPFVRIAETTHPVLVRELLTKQWELFPPRILMSICGDSAQVNLPPKLHEFLSKGLHTVARSNSVWLFTDGLDSGVSQYVGRVTASTGTTVGIAPWAKVTGKKRLESIEKNGYRAPTRGNATFYGLPETYQKDHQATCLEPNHTHFILVDDGSLQESAASLQHVHHRLTHCVGQLMSEGRFGVSSCVEHVMLCIQGDAQTLRMCVDALDRGTRVIAVHGSGGVADLLSYSWRLLHRPTRALSEEGLDKLIRSRFRLYNLRVTSQAKHFTEYKKLLLRCAVYPVQMLTVYSCEPLYSSGSTSFEGTILHAIFPAVDHHFESPQQRDQRNAVELELAMIWDRVDVATAVLAQGRFLCRLDSQSGSPSALMQAKVDMLSWALVHHKIEIAKLILDSMERKDVEAFLRLKSQPNIGSIVPRPTVISPNSFVEGIGKPAQGLLSDLPDPQLYRERLPHHLTDYSIALLVGLHEEHGDKAEARQYGKFVLRSILGQGYMVALGKHWEPQKPINIVKFETVLVRTLAKNIHHKWAREQIEDGLTPEANPTIVPFDQLPAARRQNLQDQARGQLESMLERGFRIWQPDRFEILFGSFATKDSAAGCMGWLLQTGFFWRDQILEYMASLFSRDYRLDLVKKAAPLSPYYMLLIWAILSQCKALAEYFWKQDSKHSLHSALAAAAVCHHLANDGGKLGPEDCAIYEDIGKHFRKLTVSILRKCSTADADSADAVVLLQLPETGYVAPWMLAWSIGFGEFCAQPACLRVLQKEWQGRVQSLGTFKFWLCAIFPPYAFIPPPVQPNSVTGHVLHNLFLHVDTTGPEGRQTRSFWKRLVVRSRGIYHSPKMAYWLEIISFLILCLLFSYTTLLQSKKLAELDFHRKDDLVQMAVWGWMATMIVDEIRQGVSHGFEAWAESGWNLWDCALYTLYLASMLVRLLADASMLRWSRILQAMVVVMLWARLARYFSVDANLGPKVIMLRRMADDLWVFASLLAFVMLGYGVAAQALMRPNRPVDSRTVTELFFQPYFQVYGELFLDSIQDSTDCLGPLMTDCGQSEGIALMIFLAFYVLFANIVLVNLLIAMMSKTYDQVNEAAQQTWSLLYVDILIEFEDKWLFPAPLNVLRNIYLIFSAVWAYQRRVRKEGLSASLARPLKVRHMAKAEQHRLLEFVSNQTKEYVELGDVAIIDEQSSDVDVLRSDVYKLQIALRKSRRRQQRQLDRIIQLLKHGTSPPADGHSGRHEDEAEEDEAEENEAEAEYGDGDADVDDGFGGLSGSHNV